jgi:endonuclease YncB( thermonuclease family)
MDKVGVLAFSIPAVFAAVLLMSKIERHAEVGPTEATAVASQSSEDSLAKGQAPAPNLPKEDTLVGRASVIDGDTIEMRGRRIRLNAIDAPEASQTCRAKTGSWPCGRRAASALTDLIASRTVSCRPSGTDRYGRLVAGCAVGGVDIGSWMVEQGWALAFRRYGTDYVAAEERARAAGVGVWAGSFVPPWDFRAGASREVTAGSYTGR